MKKVQVDGDDGNTMSAYPISFLIMGGAPDWQVKRVVDFMFPSALGDCGDDKYSTLPLALACQNPLTTSFTIQLLIEKCPAAAWLGSILPIQYYLGGTIPPEKKIVELFVRAHPKCINERSIGIAFRNEACTHAVLLDLADRCFPDDTITRLVLDKDPSCGGGGGEGRPRPFITSQRVGLLARSALLPHIRELTCNVGAFDLDAFSTFLRILASANSHVRHLDLTIPGEKNGFFYRYALLDFVRQNCAVERLRIEGESFAMDRGDDDLSKALKANATLQSLCLNGNKIV